MGPGALVGPSARCFGLCFGWRLGGREVGIGGPARQPPGRLSCVLLCSYKSHVMCFSVRGPEPRSQASSLQASKLCFYSPPPVQKFTLRRPAMHATCASRHRALHVRDAMKGALQLLYARTCQAAWPTFAHQQTCNLGAGALRPDGAGASWPGGILSWGFLIHR